MKPETKRWLAREWIIFLCSLIISASATFIEQYSDKKSSYWNTNPENTLWISDIKSAEVPKFLTGLQNPSCKEVEEVMLHAKKIGELSDANILSKTLNDYRSWIASDTSEEALAWKATYRSSLKGEWRCFAQVFSLLLLDIVVFGVVGGAGVYVLSWILRATVGAMKTLWRKPERTELTLPRVG